ncbi:GNAT family N-acetyltransferase [Lachnospiraceae bacterium 46-61]
MYIRKYICSDCKEMAELFYNTVHTINAKDYTKEQCNVWADGNINLTIWNQSFCEHFTIVAVENNHIIGFGDMDNTGYIDRLYVHKNFQNKGIASAICNELEKSASVYKITTHASITAKSFFEHRGYEMIKKQQVIKCGIALINYVMEKALYYNIIE